jgi:hypothetical protein
VTVIADLHARLRPASREHEVGSGITHDYQAPATGERSLTLKVSDPGGLQADAPVQTVTVQ